MSNMARPTKRGLEYFPIDIDIFSDLKIRKLIKYQGGKSISIYTLLLCKIYKNGYYIEWDEELPFICSELTGFDEAYISEVIKTCLTLGLFSKELFDDKGVLTSKGIQERFSRICIQCRRVCNISDYNLLTPKTPTPRSRSNQWNGRETERQNASHYEPYSLTLDQEIEALKASDIWLNQSQLLHGIDKDTLRSKLDDFRIQCLADGKDCHSSLQDAKQHFNNWLRKTLSKNDNNFSRPENRRKGNILNPDEPKAYDSSF